MNPAGAPWGLVAEFDTADALLAAVRAARERGLSGIEAYSPLPVEGLAEALGFAPRAVAPITFVAAVLGGALAYFLQWYSAVVAFPIDVGGRPIHSWPMFIPVTFEVAVLAGAIAAFCSAVFGNRLPDLAHPAFSLPDFDLASRDRFFLCLRADDPRFDSGRERAWLAKLQPVRCQELRR